MKQEIIISSSNLPSSPADLSDFIVVGNEALNAKRAQLRAMQKIGAANENRLKVLKEAQDLADAVLDAEVVLGSLISEATTKQGKRTDLKLGSIGGTKLSKKDVIEQIGISKTQAHRYETMSDYPEIVEQMKINARETGEIVNQAAVLRAIKKPFTTHNSGNTEWYTPIAYIESARKVLGNIDLDPASCEAANIIVHAKQFYSEDDDGLSKEWYGTIWLNPPYSQVSKFIEKLLNSNFKQAIVLVNNATETQWAKALANRASAIVFHTTRLRFVDNNGINGTPMQGQMLVYIGDNADSFLAEFGQYGWCVKTVKQTE